MTYDPVPTAIRSIMSLYRSILMTATHCSCSQSVHRGDERCAETRAQEVNPKVNRVYPGNPVFQDLTGDSLLNGHKRSEPTCNIYNRGNNSSIQGSPPVMANQLFPLLKEDSYRFRAYGLDFEAKYCVEWIFSLKISLITGNNSSLCMKVFIISLCPATLIVCRISI